jgi:thiopeptide-type bacteriocin biosynthesis protein
VTQHELYECLCAAIAESLPNAPANGGRERQSIDAGAFIETAAVAALRVYNDQLASHHSDVCWIYLRIPVRDSPVRVIQDCIRPLVQRLADAGLSDEWWWLTKLDLHGLALRCRIAVSPANKSAAEDIIAAELAERASDVVTVAYEPEFCLFGGPTGMSLAHAHFCSDSRFLLGWLEDADHSVAPILSEGLALALAIRMLRAARLDVFEMWDVFARVREKRSVRQRIDLEPFAVLTAKVLEKGPERIFELFSGKRRDLIEEHVRFLDQFGMQLNDAHFGGRMTCGIREFLAPVILFHWNRVGFSTVRQGSLCTALVTALAGLSHGEPSGPTALLHGT